MCDQMKEEVRLEERKRRAYRVFPLDLDFLEGRSGAVSHEAGGCLPIRSEN